MELEGCRLAFGDNPDRRCAWCGVTLPRGRRRWCSDAHGQAWRDNHVWQYARQAAIERDHFSCVRCGTASMAASLEVHHKDPVALRGGYSNGCQHHLAGLVTLCSVHHDQEERWRRGALVEWPDGTLSEQLRLPVG